MDSVDDRRRCGRPIATKTPFQTTVSLPQLDTESHGSDGHRDRYNPVKEASNRTAISLTLSHTNEHTLSQEGRTLMISPIGPGQQVSSGISKLSASLSAERHL